VLRAEFRRQRQQPVWVWLDLVKLLDDLVGHHKVCKVLRPSRSRCILNVRLTVILAIRIPARRPPHLAPLN
jgi:hypothetical protein